MTGCELNQIFLGEIAAVQNYGAFVRIPGCAQQGLIHKSQVSSSRVDDVGEILQRGERVWCKIISINEDGKISLSMKLVNQGNGVDLDPTGVQQQRDDQRRKSSVPGQRKVIELQAVLNTTCGKCGTHGHLSNDCFMSPDGKTYELLPEIEEDDEKDREKEEDKEVKDKEEKLDSLTKAKKHKSKKSKNKKNKKKSKSTEESGDSDSKSEDRNDNRSKKSGKKRTSDKKKEKKKKEKKRRSRENSSQSYSTDNDDDNETLKHSLKRKSSDNQGRERRTKKCKYSSSKR